MNEAFEISKFNKQLRKIKKLKKKLKAKRLGMPSTETKRLSKVINLLDYAIGKLEKIRNDFKAGEITKAEAREQIKKSRNKLKSTLRYLKQKDLIGLIGDAASYRLATLIQSVVSMLVLGSIAGASLLLAWEEEEEESLVEHKMSLEEMLNSPEAKKMYRELAKKHHPDKKSGSNRVMRKINNAKETGDAAMKRLYNELEDKPAYSDIKEPKETFSFQNSANEAADFLNKELKNEGYWFHFIVRKSGKMTNLMLNIKWPEGHTSSFVMNNIKKYKDNHELFSAIMKFIRKRM